MKREALNSIIVYVAIISVITLGAYLLIGRELFMNGRGRVLSDREMAEYNILRSEYERSKITFSEADINKFREAAIFLMSSGVSNVEKIEEKRGALNDVIHPGIFERLIAEAQTVVDEQLDDLHQEDEWLGNGGLVDDGEVKHPIYDIYGNVMGYGTLAESEESLERIRDLPENTITEAKVYRDIVVFEMAHKFAGALRLKIYNNQVVDYKVLQ